MTSRERILAALNLQEPDQVPFADDIDDGMVARLAARLGDPEMDFDEFAQRFGVDAIYIRDYLPPIFCTTATDPEGYEVLQEGYIKSEADLAKMVFPDPTEAAFYDKAKGFVDRYGPSDLGLYAFLRSGMMATIYSMGWMTFSEALAYRPSLVRAVFERYVEWNCEVVARLQEVGLDFFFVCDDIAYNSGPMFSPQVLRELFMPGLQQMAAVFKIPWVFHSDGDLTSIVDDLLTLGMNAINPIQPDVMDIRAVKKKYGDRVCLWGNVDLNHTLCRGTVAEVEAEVKGLIRDIAPGGGYILSSSNSLTVYCQEENLLAMAKAVKRYGRYPIQLHDC